MSNLPITFQDKENSPELLAYLQQFGEKSYLSAEEINQIRDSINELAEGFLPDAVLKTGTISITGLAVNIAANAFAWRINQQSFLNPPSYGVNLTAAADGFYRADIIVGTSTGTYQVVQGNPSATTAIEPNTPEGTIRLAGVVVFGMVVGQPTPTPITNFIEKSERANVVLTGSGVINQLDLVDEKATIVFKGSITRLNTISYASVPYNGKRITLFNAQATPVTIGHSVSGFGVDFVFANGQDYVLAPNETIEFSFDITYAPYAHHMLIGSKGIGTWSELQGKPSTFPPSAHTHTVSQITDFPTFKTIENQSIVGAGNIDLNKSDVGLSNVDNTSDLNKPISTATQTALNGKEPIIPTGTALQYIKGDKTLGTFPTVPTVDQTIINGSTNAVSGNAVFDGLALKVSGSGTTNYVPKFTSSETIENSSIYDNGTNVLVGTVVDNGIDKLQVNGSAKFSSSVTSQGLTYGKAINYTGDLNDLTEAGFYDGAELINAPINGWFHYSVQRHANNDYWVVQTATGFGGPFTTETYIRTKSYGIWQPWVKLLDTGNLVDPITGTLATNYIPKATGANSLGNSSIYDDGINVGIGTTSPSTQFDSRNASGSALRASNTSGGYAEIGITSNDPSTGYINFTNSLAINGGNTLFGKTNDAGDGVIQVNGNITASPAVSPNQVVVKSQLDAVAGVSGTYTSNGINLVGFNDAFYTIKFIKVGRIVTCHLNGTCNASGSSGAFTFDLPSGFPRFSSSTELVSPAIFQNSTNQIFNAYVKHEKTTPNTQMNVVIPSGLSASQNHSFASSFAYYTN